MNVLLIEDEAIAVRRTRNYLKKYGQSLVEVGWTQSVSDTISWLEEHPHPDLIISDIELLDGNVFNLFDQRQIDCPVIFATAYDQFLLKAFEANGVGYLLKPYTYEQFSAAIDKVALLLGSKTKEDTPSLSNAAVLALQAALQKQHLSYRERFTIKRPSGITILPCTQVSLILSEDKVVFAVDREGKKHPLSQSLTQLSSELDPAEWFQVNRSEIVHLPFIEKVNSYGRDRLAVHLIGMPNPAVASRDKTPELRKWLG